MVYDRAHTRQISELSGLAGQMPVIAGLLAFASFASLGIPGLSGFVGEFLSLLGAWQSDLAASGWCSSPRSACCSARPTCSG